MNKRIDEILSQHATPKVNIKDVVSKPHFIFTPEHPAFPDKNILGWDFDETMKKLEDMGFSPIPAMGKYRSFEKSIVVPVESHEQLDKLEHISADLGQESSLYSDGTNHQLIYHHDKDKHREMLGTGTTWHDVQPGDAYTEVGGEYFTHHLEPVEGEDEEDEEPRPGSKRKDTHESFRRSSRRFR